MEVSKKTYSWIDFAKLFFAFGIIALHTGFLLNNNFGYYIHTIFFRLGVPFFFICSGYFLGFGITKENKKEKFIKFIKKLIVPYFIFGTIYMFLGIVRSGDLSATNVLNQIWYLITGRSLSVIWFLGSLIISSIFLLHVNTKKYLKRILIFFALLFLLGLLFNTYSFLIIGNNWQFIYNFLSEKFGNNSNFLFIGLLFVGIGYYLKVYGVPKLLNSCKKRVIILFFGFFLLIFESILIKNHLDVVVNYEYFISHLLIIPVLFLILINANLNIDTTKIRKTSSLVYYAHYLFIYLLIFVSQYFPNTPLSNNTVFYFTTLISTLIFSSLIQRISNGVKSEKEKILRYIIFSLYFLAAIFIFYTLIILINGVVWADEVCSLAMTKHSILDIIKINVNDVHPPLYYAMLKLFIDFVNLAPINIDAIYLGKLFSIIPLLILQIFSLTKINKYFGRLTSAIFSFVIMVAPQFIYFFVEIRMYSWAVCFVSIAFIYLYEVIKNNNNRSWVLFTIFCIMASYTHLYACLAAGLLYLGLLIYLIMNKKKLRNWFIYGGITILCYLPWLLVIFGQIKNTVSGFWIPQITFNSIVEYIRFVFFPTTDHTFIGNILGCLLLFVTVMTLIYSYFSSKKNNQLNWYTIIGYSVLIFTAGIGIIVSIVLNPMFVSRYMFCSLGCMWLSFSIIISKISNKKQHYLLVLIIPLLVTSLNFYNFVQTENIKNDNMKKYFNYIDKIENNAIIISNDVHMEFEMAYFRSNNIVYLWNNFNNKAMLSLYPNIRDNATLSNIEKWFSEGKIIYFVEHIGEKNLLDEFKDTAVDLIYEGNYSADWYYINVYKIIEKQN